MIIAVSIKSILKQKLFVKKAYHNSSLLTPRSSFDLSVYGEFRVH